MYKIFAIYSERAWSETDIILLLKKSVTFGKTGVTDFFMEELLFANVENNVLLHCSISPQCSQRILQIRWLTGIRPMK